MPPFLLRTVRPMRTEERELSKPEAKVPFADEAAVHEVLARVLPLEASALDTYPWTSLTGLPSKLTVTEIRERLGPLVTEEGSPTAFAPWAEKVASAETAEESLRRGTAVHTFLRFVDIHLAADQEALAQELDRLIEEGRLEPEDRPLIPLGQIRGFLSHPLGKRLRRAQNIYRERPFLWNLPAEVAAALMGEGTVSGMLSPVSSETFPYARVGGERWTPPIHNLRDFCAWIDDTRKKSRISDDDARFLTLDAVVVQGIFDVLFREDEGYVLLDYKTDRFLNPRTYAPQLYVYACAMRDLLGELPREGWLYAFGEELAGKGRFADKESIDRAVRVF